MAERKSIWDRGNVLEALKANHASLIILSFISAIFYYYFLHSSIDIILACIKYFTHINSHAVEIEFMAKMENGLAEHFMQAVIAFFVVASILRLIILILAHHRNRFEKNLTLNNRKVYSYLWIYFKRWLFSFIVAIPFLIACVFVGIVLQSIGAIIANIGHFEGNFIRLFLDVLVQTSYTLFSYMYFALIYPPLMGDNEDKGYKKAFENLTKIFIPFIKETILPSIGIAIVGFIIFCGVVASIIFSRTNPALSEIKEVILFFVAYLNVYFSMVVSFVFATIFSQYYLELQSKETDAVI